MAYVSSAGIARGAPGYRKTCRKDVLGREVLVLGVEARRGCHCLSYLASRGTGILPARRPGHTPEVLVTPDA